MGFFERPDAVLFSLELAPPDLLTSLDSNRDLEKLRERLRDLRVLRERGSTIRFFRSLEGLNGESDVEALRETLPDPPLDLEDDLTARSLFFALVFVALSLLRLREDDRDVDDVREELRDLSVVMGDKALRLAPLSLNLCNLFSYRVALATSRRTSIGGLRTGGLSAVLIGGGLGKYHGGGPDCGDGSK